MARYLVTGGCGFIGSHLVGALQTSGHEVRVLDDLSTGKRQNVTDATELMVGSVVDPKLVRSALRGVDGVFHLAAIASVDRSRNEWTLTHETNLTGFINVLDAVRRTGAPIPVVYASSAAVYGESDRTPIKETATLHPLTAYGADKLSCELHAHVGAVVHRLPSTGLRFFNVYGPNQDPNSPYSGVISVFCDRLRRGEAVDIYGDGLQVRDFIYVADVVRFLLKAMETTVSGSAVLNVCTGKASSVRELVDIIAEQCSVVPSINFRPGRPGDIRASVGCPWLTAGRLGLKAQIDVREGLSRTLASMSEETTTGNRRFRPRPWQRLPAAS